MASETQELTDADFQAPKSVPQATTSELTDADFAKPTTLTVSEPPIPQQTTFVSDRNTVVGHSADLSHDQVNDAVQTGVYGIPRTNFHDRGHYQPSTPLQSVPGTTPQLNANAPFTPAPDLLDALDRGVKMNPQTSKMAPELLKAVIRGPEDIARGMAGLADWMGDGLQHGEGNGIKMEPEFVQEIGRHMADMSQAVSDYLKQREATGFEAPDPETFRGSFVSNPSMTRVAAGVVQGIPMLAAASLITAATGNPFAGAAAIGLHGAGEEFESAKEQGASLGRASLASGLSGIGNSLLMSIPLGHYLEGFGTDNIPMGVFKGAAEGAGLNLVMNPFNNIVARIGGAKARNLFEGMAESTISMAASMGILSGFSQGHGAKVDGLIQEAHKAGVPAKDIDAVRTEIGRQLSENPDVVNKAIDQVKFKRKMNQEMKEAGKAILSNPELKAGGIAVYNDIKTKLESVDRPPKITPSAWRQQIQDAAQFWSAHVVTEAQKRGIPVDDVYRGMRPRIITEIDKATLEELKPPPNKYNLPKPDPTAVNIYFIPHGETEIDAAEKNHGNLNPGINKKGEKQSQKIADALAQIDLQKVYEAGAKRSKETAKIVAKPSKADVVADKDLRAIDKGPTSGKLKSEIEPLLHDAFSQWSVNPDKVLIGDESLTQAFTRQIEALKRTIFSHAAGDRVGLVVNSDVAQLLRNMSENGGAPPTPEQIENFLDKESIKQGDISIYKYDPATGQLSMVKENALTHPKENPMPERHLKSVVERTMTSQGDEVKITHGDAIKEAMAKRDEAIQQWEFEKSQNPIENIEKMRWTKSLEKLGDFKDVPWWVKKKFFTNRESAPDLDVVAGKNGITDTELIAQITNYEKTVGKAPPKDIASYYDEGIRSLKEHWENYPGEQKLAQEPNENPTDQESPQVEVEPGIFFQDELFKNDKENLADTYERLREQALSQGMNPAQAAKWAKENLPTERKALISNENPKQQEFGADGVQGFGQGRQSEQELFQTPMSAPTFYSKLADVVDEKVQPKSSPDQILGVLKNAGVKQEEMDWMGLEDFLKGKKSVTKEELQKFIAENNVQVQEVIKGQVASHGQAYGEGTKFEKYVLPGGDNYRELLLTLPNAEAEKLNTRRKEIEALGRNATKEQKDEWVALMNKLQPDNRDIEGIDKFRGFPEFKSSHFSERNILAHVRFNDRTDAQGNKVLFLEEVQSDWHQKGREKGYGTKLPTQDQAKGFFGITDEKWAEMNEETKNSYVQEMSEHRAYKQEHVPDAPFKKIWHELALKWMLRYAAENGYDKLAWTTGEQQAERYDLSKQIDSIDYFHKVGGNNYMIEAKKDDSPVITRESISADRLPDLLGKEIAKKIIDGGSAGTLKGIDLKVGGEGMKGFYDQMIPSFLNKYAKKWGGRVGESEITGKQEADVMNGEEDDSGSFKAPSIDITPSMKESVIQEGQPLFQGDKKPKGSTTFSPEGIVIKLMTGADASTFMHESAHVWLKDIHEYVKSGKADENYLKDWNTLSNWLGVKEGAEKLTVGQQEKFARGFESYLREGNAPSSELTGIFERMKEWLTQIYKSAKALRVDLSSAVRQVMDRMLTIPEEKPETLNQETTEKKYVINRPFESEVKETDKKTARDIREKFSGLKNEQIVRGNQLREEIKRDVPNQLEREGMFWYKAANGDRDVLAEALNDPKFQEYHDQILKALDLSQKAIDALGKIDQYYSEAGQVSQEIGTIKNVRENYQNRIYKPEPPQDFVKSETKSGIKQSTGHALKRVFDTEFDAVQAGKKFATTDVADALSIHNEELARVNASRKMADAMVESGLGAWKKEVPDGWARVGNLEKNVPIKDKNGEAVIGEDGNQLHSRSMFVAPEGIAKGLEAIADPNFTKKIDTLRGLQKYQGLVKTVDLSYSFFHHFTMAMQMAYQGGIGGMLKLPWMSETLADPEFGEMEQDFVKHTGMTSAVESNQDIFRNLTDKNQDTFSKITNLPVVKQVLDQANKNADFLFGKVQRYMKVMDYGRKMANWVADNPEATNEQVRDAKIGFAKEINAAYGGLNWEAMGMTKSNLSLLRLGLLAPDWTISNMQLLQMALGDKGTGGKAARSHILTALVGGMVLTEGLNKMLTGHFTDKNKEGHKLEIEIAPDVYVSLLRGGIGDITKLTSNLIESGPLQGSARFLQGKLAPIPRTAAGLLTNTQYTGRPIGKKAEGPIKNTYDVLKYLFASNAPVPFGMSNLAQYLTGNQKKTIPGAVSVGTGLGRYSKSGSSGGGREKIK